MIFKFPMHGSAARLKMDEVVVLHRDVAVRGSAGTRACRIPAYGPEITHLLFPRNILILVVSLHNGFFNQKNQLCFDLFNSAIPFYTWIHLFLS
jgi:hypothetical protein